MLEDELIKGAIDFHVHCWPEFSLHCRGRLDDIAWAKLARDAGMPAIVMKDNLFPSAVRAYIIGQVVPEIKVFGGIALNPSVGGLSPFAVEATAEMGGKVVWMPTWGSRNDILRGGGFVHRMSAHVTTAAREFTNPDNGITVLDSKGHLVAAVQEILQIIRRYDMILSSGHLSIEESLILAEAAQKLGVKFVLSHPLHKRIDASIDQQKEIVRMGGYIEHCFVITMPMYHRLELSRVTECIRAVGAEHCIISSDVSSAWDPPSPELLRMFIGSLLALGIDAADIRRMAQENPAKLLGLF